MKNPLNRLTRPSDRTILRPELIAAQKRQAERAQQLAARRQQSSIRPEKKNGR